MYGVVWNLAFCILTRTEVNVTHTSPTATILLAKMGVTGVV